MWLSSALSLVALVLGTGPLAWSSGPSFISAAQCAEFRASFPKVRFYIEARGGFGDVAAGLYSAIVLSEECPSEYPVEIMAEGATTQKILDALAAQLKDRMKNIEVLGSMASLWTPDLVIYPAAGWLKERALMTSRMVTDTMYLFAPVFSDSESENAKERVGIIQYRGVSHKTGVPGLGLWENGVYPDPSAAGIKELNKVQLREFLNSESQVVGMGGLGRFFNDELRVGFAYGASFSVTESYFLGYMLSLRQWVGRSEPTVILSPSRVKDRVNKWMSTGKLNSDEFEVFALKELSADWKPAVNKVTVIETGFLPPSLFSGLMAYSAANEVVPLGAGDGFISAAMELGIPFVMTQVTHNEKVIHNYLENFEAWLDRSVPHRRAVELNKLLKEIYRPSSSMISGYSSAQVVAQMMRSQELAQFGPEHSMFARGMPKALTAWMESAVLVKKQNSLRVESKAQLSGPDDLDAENPDDDGQMSFSWPQKVKRFCESLLKTPAKE